MDKTVYEFIANHSGDSISQRKTCPWCGDEFAIYEGDLELLHKLSPTIGGKKYELPVPDKCPKCRQIQRLARRNESKLYRNKSAITGKNIIATYPIQSGYKVYEGEKRRSDEREGLDYGQDFDFNKSFFEQFAQLLQVVPKSALLNFNVENSDYANLLNDSKNCYLTFGSGFMQDCMYTNRCYYHKNILDCLFCHNGELDFMNVNCKQTYKCRYCQDVKNSSDCWFCYGCENCNFCFGCVGMVNQQYMIYNKQYTKQDYEEKIAQLIAPENVEKNKQDLLDLRKEIGYQALNIVNSQNCYGNEIKDSKDCIVCYQLDDSQDARYCAGGLGFKTVMDASRTGIDELCYMICSGGYHQGVIGMVSSAELTHSQYGFENFGKSNLFGCTGLKNKEYCIFNKQYTKQEYEQLVDKIIHHMMDTGEWGDFFPIHCSPFPYNDTVASQYYPVHSLIYPDGTKKVLDEQGYGVVYLSQPQEFISDAQLDLGGNQKINIKRRTQEQEPTVPDGMNTISADTLPLGAQDIGEDILDKALICAKSGRPYRIVKTELEFLHKHNLSLPHLHPDIRQQYRIKQLPGYELYIRKCDETGKQILSVYPQEVDFPVYSYDVYQKKIYG